MIINITGQVCAGKTILAKKLGDMFHLPVFSIDEYRLKTKSEVDAWLQICADARGYESYILDSSGLNGRLLPLLKGKTVTIKLICDKKTALKRLKAKKKPEIKLPYREFKTHKDFIDYWRENQHRIKEDLKIDTSTLTPDAVLNKITEYLNSLILGDNDQEGSKFL